MDSFTYFSVYVVLIFSASFVLPQIIIWCLAVWIATTFCRRTSEGFVVAWACTPVLAFILGYIVENCGRSFGIPSQTIGMAVLYNMILAIFTGIVPGYITEKRIAKRRSSQMGGESTSQIS